MNIGALPAAQLRQRLAGAGLTLHTGCFSTRIRTAIDHVAAGIGLLYADYPLVDAGGFADFHVCVTRPRGLRRWLKPQVEFLLDGAAAFKPLPLEQALPVLEWGLNWCVSNHAHRYLMIHAAVIEKHGHAALLPAPPGSGKSTLCAALVNRGWRLLSDEIALIALDDGRIVPLPRPVSLKNASIDIIARYEPNALLSRPVSDTQKGTVAYMKAPVDSVARARQAARPGWIVFPQYRQGAPARMEPLPKSRAFMRAADNAFNYSLLGVRGFDALGRLIDASQCHTFSYGALDDAVAAFAALTPASNRT